jgi:hypothetical protein
MSVVWAKQTAQREYKTDDALTEQGQRIYLVKCSSENDGPDVAAGGCPTVGASWSTSRAGLVVKSVSVREESRAGGTLFLATVDYSTESETDPSQTAANPLYRYPEVSMDFETFDETVYKQEGSLPTAIDAAGNTVTISAPPGGKWRWGNNVCNSAGKDFDQQPSRTYWDPVLTITRNESVLPWQTMIEYAGAVNNDSFNIVYRGATNSVAIGQARMVGISSQSQYENGVRFERVTYRIALREDGWKTKESNNGDWPARPIRDANGDPVTRPVLLNGLGVSDPDGPPVFLQFKLYKEKAFGSLDLDEPELP